MGSSPGSGRSPGEGNGNPFLCSHPGNPMAREAWQAIVHGVAKESDMTSWLYNNNKILGGKVEGMILLGKVIWEIFTEVINLLEQGFLSGSNGLSGNSQCNIMMTSMSFVQRRQWHPTPVLLPGKFHGRRSLVGYSPWDHKELDMTEQLH